MTQLELKLAQVLGKALDMDIEGIINAARSPDAGINPQTVGTPPAVVETAAPPQRSRKSATVNQTAPANPDPAPSAPPPATPPPAPQPEPPKAPEAPQAPAQAPAGVDLTGLVTGSGASKKVVKAVFLAAVEKADTLAKLLALHNVCECGLPNVEAYTEETAGLLKKKLARWGNAQQD